MLLLQPQKKTCPLGRIARERYQHTRTGRLVVRQPLGQEGAAMTPDDVRAAAEQLVQFHERFAPLFGKDQVRDHAYDYLKGLMVCPERKSIEPIALPVGHGEVSGLQKFVGAAPRAYDDDVMAEVQGLFAAELAPSAAGAPVGVV